MGLKEDDYLWVFLRLTIQVERIFKTIGQLYCTICDLFQDALDAMKALGLNPGEQEMIDMTNEVSQNGLIYYPDFCKLVLRKYREENKEVLNQALFKVSFHDINWTENIMFTQGYLRIWPLSPELQSQEMENQGQVLHQGWFPVHDEESSCSCQWRGYWWNVWVCW